ncbi:hypothetical protein BFU36_09620 [Sulfolobus sp. A20]|uniref:hypothetical protein n=1 Tax=Sulfolobaceae TaxID=118883 RepID=UPI0008460AB3|nr:MULTISPECIES: hypothetical protein [unclassified Sulfolobus]TRM76887.1 hypothetical protein DJ532_06570 [Sulfolobus sp. A20-N-F8]TRM78242.1 hypothetical protein DJ528_05095 [Sulfolobus sp. B5]TRM88175.1 hypothetical protein DJ529_06165 [Sulfolobus sp. C3]TRM94906.1 hypothetical protein DJ526_01320 [Sulfolobus sp. A20-N-G8]TRN02097.1 hypothetical protein DJ527_04465 [Sulfolobus sp. F1]TRN02945.1 hypothetical protein DJ530_03695 [Sulfolobus sp. E1]
MDKYLLALLGEAGATGLAKGYSIRYSFFKEAYENEKRHWEYFKRYRRSLLEGPIYVIFLVLGVLTSLLGMSAVKKMNEIVEKGAIDFYVKNFDVEKDVEIKEILRDEMKHLEYSI